MNHGRSLLKLRIIDLSRNLDTNTPPFPGDSAVEINVTHRGGAKQAPLFVLNYVYFSYFISPNHHIAYK